MKAVPNSSMRKITTPQKAVSSVASLAGDTALKA
jgi:hypothetical protein